MSEIRHATEANATAIWSILEPVFRGGETYMIARDITREAALAYWLDARHETFIAVEGEQVLGTYYLRANQGGGGAHVANCGYITAPAAQGRGIARAMLNHSLERARQRGFRAMQFNCVVSTNTRAVALWQDNGFAIVGTLPGAFCHPAAGYVDALVMYRQL
jgi:ribosomal protein S18 acetylase RimI-like enzyme